MEEQKHGQLMRFSTVLAAFLILAVSFIAGALYGYNNRPAVERVLNVTGQNQPENFSSVDFNLFWDVWSRLENDYVDKNKFDRKAFVYGAIKGLVKSLEDPYTEFLPPPETKQFQEDIAGSFEGIGAEIGIRKDILTIISPLKDSPAEKAGLKAGDKVLQIGDKPTPDLTLNDAVRLIRGPKGTEVKLLIFREGFDQPKEFKVTRDTIRVSILTTEKKDGGIFVIKLNQFTENAGIDFRNAVQEFLRSDSKKLILDLRNNPGGYLVVAVDIASWFLPAGETVAREKYADDTEDVYRSHGYRFLENIPVVVLVNQGSASASEILAGALRDINGTKLVGTKTFGKGSVQEVQPLPDGSSLKLTIAKWLTPKGTEINGIGLEPDVKVELPEESAQDPAKDPVMEKGIEVLNSL